MVYKRYIKRDGKTFGPYYYESYRDDKGRTRTRLVNAPKKNKFSKLIYVLIAFSLILILGIFILNNNFEGGSPESSFEEKSDINLEKTPFSESKILGSFIKLIGFNIENIEEQQEVVENTPETTEYPQEGHKEIIEDSPEIIEEIPSEENPPENIENESTQENISKNITDFTTEINQTQENTTTETNVSSENQQINVTAQNISGQISENISLINETLQNVSEIIVLQANNYTISESIIQYSAKLGEPVKWKKTLKFDAGENETLNNLEVTLPKTAGDVSVIKIFANESVEELKVNVKNEKLISETEPVIFITGQSVKNEEKKNIFSKIFKFFRNFFSLVGRVIDIGENENAVLVSIQEELEDNDEIEIEYYTEAPYSEEITFSEAHKEINVVGSEEIHYENILAFSNLSKEVSEEKIRLYRTSDGIKEQTGFIAYDNNNNELIDYIEWIVPSLSNQTYEIILITKAQHLDSNKNFISDIYNEVKALDGNWSEQINDSEYVRVTFEKNLTNENDITIYPRTISPRDDSGEPNGTLRIEIYEFNKTELIAEFTNIIDNEYNKVYLTNLQGSQNTFDLKIVGGSVEFDYIVDPFSGPSGGVWMDLSANDTGDWAGTAIVYGVAVNPNDNLVYTGLSNRKFGVYNNSNGIWMDLSANDTGDWAGTNVVYGIAVNPNDNLVYTGLSNGKFGVYDNSNGIWMDLSANDTGNWAGTNSVTSVAVNSNDNLVYTGLEIGKFGVYNHSNGVWMDLSANDTNDWVEFDSVWDVAVNPNDNLVYTGLDSGKFGVYNHSNGVWMNLSGNDTGNWVGTTYIQSVAVNPNNNLVYTGLASGKFGVYNHSNGVWMDLSGNDTGDWAGTNVVYGIAVNPNDNLVYTGLDNGKFGAYTHSNGVWMDLSGNDTGNWVGTSLVYSVAVNPNDNLVYTGLSSGKFGVYRADLFPGGGAGTLTNPYEIADCVQLQNMSLNLNSHFKLMNNIDCSDTINWNSGAGFEPVGTSSNVFRGSLQGQGYNITDLYIKLTNAATEYVGMFGYAINTTINDVHLWNLTIDSTGNNVVGGIAGAFDKNGTIANSSVQGNISYSGSVTSGGSYLGGLTGWIWDNNFDTPEIYNSSFTGNLSSTAANLAFLGGIAGWSDGIINYSFAIVDIQERANIGEGTPANVGGLVGSNIVVSGSNTGIIDNSYSKGNVSGNRGVDIGGLVGDNHGFIYHSYSTADVSGQGASGGGSNSNAGGLIGAGNAGFVLNSYSCGNVDGNPTRKGGFIGFADFDTNTNYTYSAGVVGGGGTIIGGFVGRNVGLPYYNFSFWDYEIAGGAYNDTGDNGNVSGIFANTTVQMKKQGTYSAEGWDFTNTWQISEDYSYPYFKWQSTPACGTLAPISTPLSGSSSSTDLELSKGYSVNPISISVISYLGETKKECFTIKNTGYTTLFFSLGTSGSVAPFTSLSDSGFNLNPGNSKSVCADISSKLSDALGNYTGGGVLIKSFINKKVYINLELINATISNMTNVTNISSGVLPVGIVGFLPGDPIWVLPVGIVGFLPGDPIKVLPIGIIGFLPGDPIGVLPVDIPGEQSKIAETLVKGVTVISLWIFLLLLLIIYLAVRKFIKLQDQLQGYKTREEKFEAVERLKRNLLKKESNFFEKIVDKGTIYLSEKALESKVRELKKLPAPEILSAEIRERYTSGAWLYYHRDYENALKEFERCVENEGKFWQGYQGIGSCYLAQGRIKEAITAFEKSLSINPNNAKLAELLRKCKRGEDL